MQERLAKQHMRIADLFLNEATGELDIRPLDEEGAEKWQEIDFDAETCFVTSAATDEIQSILDGNLVTDYTSSEMERMTKLMHGLSEVRWLTCTPAAAAYVFVGGGLCFVFWRRRAGAHYVQRGKRTLLFSVCRGTNAVVCSSHRV